MAYRYTRSKAKQSYEEDRKVREEESQRREEKFCKKIDSLVPGATRKTFETAFGRPDTNFVTYMMGVTGLYSKAINVLESTAQILTNALKKEKEDEEEEKRKKREIKEERKQRRLKRRRVLEEELAALKEEEEKEKDEE